MKMLADGAQEDLGRPVTLQRLLANTPDLSVDLTAVPENICASSVPQWHRLGEKNDIHDRARRGTLMGWKRYGGDFLGYQVHRPEFERICVETVVKDWQCDIADVHGFANSKSDLSQFASTNAFVEERCPRMIDTISPEKLAENLAHKEIRILHSSATSDHFAYYAWDKRVWLMNDGGSHHFAAAKYIAMRLEQRVPLQGILRAYAINPDMVASLRRDYKMFAMPESAVFGSGFFKAMESFKAPWMWHDMPAPFQQARAILLPRNERRSMRVAEELSKAGVTDFGEHLMAVATNQADRIELYHDRPVSRPRLTA
ncbi:hypothetical protein IAG25_32835 [Caballeronia sp. EK]|nr:hypothetical protein [Caballeronia sp. EK]